MARIRMHRESGVTLIELMVAMVLGLLVAAGIVTVFLSTSSSNRAQTQMARLQEEGRFAITRLKGDLSMANGQYCSNSGGNARVSTAGTYLDNLRAPTVYANGAGVLMGALSDVTTPWGSPYPAEPTSPYSLPSFLSMRGYDCTATGCTPVDPNTIVAGIPAPGKAVNDRVVGTAVLTLRYLNPTRGWAINPSGSSLVANTDGTLKQINLNPMTALGEPPVTDFQAGDLAMLADCSNAQVFAVDGGGSATLSTNTSNFAKPSGQQGSAAPKVFDFNRDFQTVTYYLKVVDNGDGQGHTTGALMRRVNGGDKTHGGSDDELVRGVERLDFRYGVEYPDGTTRFLTAAQVDASDSATPGCTATVPIAPGSGTDKGCLWRAISSIEVDLLMDGQVPLYTLSANDLQYTYGADSLTTALAAPSAHGITPSTQGFVDQMIRREFTALVSVRNFNP
jgi:type IV pilus assembly protein PilW